MVCDFCIYHNLFVKDTKTKSKLTRILNNHLTAFPNTGAERNCVKEKTANTSPATFCETPRAYACQRIHLVSPTGDSREYMVCCNKCLETDTGGYGGQEILMGAWHCGMHDLTHIPLDKMPTISQTTFSNAFSWTKSFVFWFEFQWSLFLRVQSTMSQHWSR